METIIVKPKDAKQAKAVLDVLRKMDVDVETDNAPSKEAFLESLERSADDIARHSRGEIQLKDARQLLNEL